MLTSNYSYEAIVHARAGTITETCRRAFRAWGLAPHAANTTYKKRGRPAPRANADRGKGGTALSSHARSGERPAGRVHTQRRGDGG